MCVGHGTGNGAQRWARSTARELDSPGIRSWRFLPVSAQPWANVQPCRPLPTE